MATHKAISDSTQLCSIHPECVLFVQRWKTSDEYYPCLVLIYIGAEPRTYEEWTDPIDTYDKVKALATSGLLTSIQIINRDLVEWPEELRKISRQCKIHGHLSSTVKKTNSNAMFN
ncbi:hypothetical protein JG688_00011655 [Phytophthora aleatoria]|uniref:Uncharacterized protein n=1 Tax=Phytophthora aleatoria TaxID=2496075 RepID=A0A8J5ILM1_9STRA|nr:hypothetical protein JG688_00011655 [Phytophthora aleatoria]